jgi:adenosylcobinamide hydrolase
VSFDIAVDDGVLRVRSADSRWLSTGWDGGYVSSDLVYNVTVPEGWTRTDLDAYVRERVRATRFGDAPDTVDSAPALLTGVDMEHARVARADSVTAVTTAGLSNPAVLPQPSEAETGQDSRPGRAGRQGPGTVNIIVGTERRLTDGALANLVAVVAEAKTSTLLAVTDVPGTTTDAVVVGSATDGPTTPFSGTGTAVGMAARACVRDALLASLRSRYGDSLEAATSAVAEAPYGVGAHPVTEVTRR